MMTPLPHVPLECGRLDYCGFCASYRQGAEDTLQLLRRWQRGVHPLSCNCDLCMTVRVIVNHVLDDEGGSS